MGMREQFTSEMKLSMKAGDAARTSTLRMVIAKLKDADIAARPKADAIDEGQITALLRGMVKSRRESVELYMRGGRPELASKEEAEIAVIEGFLPAAVDEDALAGAIDAAVAELGATSVKDMGKVVAALKSRFGGALDMGRAGPLVKARLSA